MRIYSNASFGLIFIFCASMALNAQEIIWSKRLMDYSKSFHSDNNRVDQAIGVPSIYPDTNLNNPYYQYCEGYILHNMSTKKKNMVRMGFNSPIKAQQVILGGIYNPGAIYSIDLILEDGKKKNVYTFKDGHSLAKFHDFHVFFEPVKVIAVEVKFQHNHINKWNLMRGIGLADHNKPIDVVPYQVNIDPQYIKKEYIDENLKASECILFSPEISPDGKTLYFVKECNTQEGQDIWYSTLNDCGDWSKPTNIGFPLNNASHNYVASIGLGGKSLLLGNRYNIDGSYASDGVSISYKVSEGKWSVPEPINIPNHINYNENSNYFLSKDEKYLVFASEDDNSLGDLDLYVSHYNSETKKWSDPLHMGKTVNTPFSEDYPYLAEDGVTMYFSSNGHIGYGAHDIYMTKRLDDTWTNWTQPVNLGTGINTCFDDKGFTISSDGRHAYLNSTSHKHSAIIDIFRINLPVEFYQIGDHNTSKVSSLKTPMRIEVR